VGEVLKLTAARRISGVPVVDNGQLVGIVTGRDMRFETRLDAARFLKISRSCIVNLDFVDSMSPDENSQFIVKMRDGTLLTANREVSRQLRASSL
jgi:DNA-binding LytR/AlgR family response regulator